MKQEKSTQWRWWIRRNLNYRRAEIQTENLVFMKRYKKKKKEMIFVSPRKQNFWTLPVPFVSFSPDLIQRLYSERERTSEVERVGQFKVWNITKNKYIFAFLYGTSTQKNMPSFKVIKSQKGEIIFFYNHYFSFQLIFVCQFFFYDNLKLALCLFFQVNILKSVNHCNIVKVKKNAVSHS